MEKDIIPPGDSVALEVIFNTRLYSGPVTKGPRIYINDGTEYQRVIVRTHVVQFPDSTSPLVISPSRLDISQPTDVVVDSRTFSLENVTGQDIIINVVDSPDAFVEPEIPLSVSGFDTVEGVVRVRPDALNQSFEKSITIELDDPLKTRFTIPVKRLLPPSA